MSLCNNSDVVDSDELYGEVDKNNNMANMSVLLEGNMAASSSAPTSTSMPLAFLTDKASKKENHAPRSVDNNAADITGITQSSALSSPGSSLPLVGISNNETAGQCQSSVKCAKGLAVVSTGLTDKYFGWQ
jgi:hypothetical protein